MPRRHWPIIAVGCGSSDDAAAADTASGLPSAQAWKFGVMADTQWIATNAGDDGMNPHSCAVEIARQIQQAFINEGVKFVVQVGDLCDKGNHNPSSSSTSFTLKFADGTSYQSGSLLAEDTRRTVRTRSLQTPGSAFSRCAATTMNRRPTRSNSSASILRPRTVRTT